jgi:hypothetical protein
VKPTRFAALRARLTPIVGPLNIAHQESMKTTRSTYKKDKYYSRVTAAVDQLLKERHVVAPVEVFMQMGNLTKEDYENWRFGRIPYLERVIQGSLSKVNRILQILRLHSKERGLYPSTTVYKKWARGRRFFFNFPRVAILRLRNFIPRTMSQSQRRIREATKLAPKTIYSSAVRQRPRGG